MEQPEHGTFGKDRRILSDWEERLAQIDWSRYRTAYGNAKPVRSQLERLRSVNEEEALSAAHDLWCGLCHQHVQIGSASLPALPFLMETFDCANDRLKAELLDIFFGLAFTSNPLRLKQRAAVLGEDFSSPPEWVKKVRAGLEDRLPAFLALRMNADPDVAEFAREIVDELASTNLSVRTLRDAENPLMPDFYTACTEFRKFLVPQGYPPGLLWVQPSDLILRNHKGEAKYFVWHGDRFKGELGARREYHEAIADSRGLALEAFASTNRWTICRVFVPRNQDEAEYLMVPPTGIKHSADVNPAPAILVERKWRWKVLGWRQRRSRTTGPLSWPR